MAQSEQGLRLHPFLPSFRYSFLPSQSGDYDSNSPEEQHHPSQLVRSRRIRILSAAILAISAVLVFAFFLSELPSRLKLQYPSALAPYGAVLPDLSEPPLDWSRFAYVQYVTDRNYLCNSVMLFEILHRLGSKPDRLMMYPARMHPDPESPSKEPITVEGPARVQRKADAYRGSASIGCNSYTKLLAFNQTQYESVLSLDSDSTVLQHMDELFLLPPAPVAMPRAYWLDKPDYFSSQLVLIQPSENEFKRVKDAIDNAESEDFDMEIINNLYGKDCLVIPHRRYDLLTGEFRSRGRHAKYLGNDYEVWDPEKILQEANFLHFSDWPVPKPWLPTPAKVKNQNMPKCETDEQGDDDCRARDLWLGFYSDFRKRRKDICGFGHTKSESTLDKRTERNPGRWEFIPSLV
ncbi:glycosyltransferase family 8 protein [Marssonina coronariae]|uniref:Glycosyltransferase family 8 protein n=1 Tax=Diplocarpon coronariae TaxID=2795749 RepID=A0A218ZGT9_9HELO|nr:glycosyltransferase family 8 protein [Marssonina coronariae]